MNSPDENAIRKELWTRKDATEAKMSEPGFGALPVDEQDAWIMSLMLDVTLDQAKAFVVGGASAEVFEVVRGKIAEAFKCGKRRALRELKSALARHGQGSKEES